MADFNDEMQRDIAKIVAPQAGCTEYYRSPSGRIVTQWPHATSQLKNRLATPEPDVLRGRAAREIIRGSQFRPGSRSYPFS